MAGESALVQMPGAGSAPAAAQMRRLRSAGAVRGQPLVSRRIRRHAAARGPPTGSAQRPRASAHRRGQRPGGEQREHPVRCTAEFGASLSQAHSSERLALALKHVFPDKPDLAGRCSATTGISHVVLEDRGSQQPEVECAVVALEGSNDLIEPIEHLEGDAHAVSARRGALDDKSLTVQQTFVAAECGLRCTKLLCERPCRLSSPLICGGTACAILTHWLPWCALPSYGFEPSAAGCTSRLNPSCLNLSIVRRTGCR